MSMYSVYPKSSKIYIYLEKLSHHSRNESLQSPPVKTLLPKVIVVLVVFTTTITFCTK